MACHRTGARIKAGKMPALHLRVRPKVRHYIGLNFLLDLTTANDYYPHKYLKCHFIF